MDYIFCARSVRNGALTNEPGPLACLAVPTSTTAPKPEHALHGAVWTSLVLDLAQNGCPWGKVRGSVVILVHGYNTSPAEMLRRHRSVRAGLDTNGFNGIVVSFDWASDDRAVSYMHDTTKARDAAECFARDALPMLLARRGLGAPVRLHLIGHSMGCRVLREAFAIADQEATSGAAWSVEDITFVAADVSAESLAADAEASRGMFARCERMTNYYSQHDEILSTSDAMRTQAGPRAGRIGVRGSFPSKAVDVYCGDYFEASRARYDANPSASHTWYFDDVEFLRDVAMTFDGQGAWDGAATRTIASTGGLALAV